MPVTFFSCQMFRNVNAAKVCRERLSSVSGKVLPRLVYSIYVDVFSVHVCEHVRECVYVESPSAIDRVQ